MSAQRFRDNHLWIRMENTDTGVIGITHFAQAHLGEIVFIALPDIGRHARMGEEVVVIESVKAATGYGAPVSGTVIEVNDTLAGDPRKVNQDPTGEGWLLRLRLDDPQELDALMDETTYLSRIGCRTRG